MPGLWDTLRTWLRGDPEADEPVAWAGEALFPARRGGATPWGYVRPDGRWVHPPTFATAGVFSEGFALVNDAGGSALLSGEGTRIRLPLHVHGVHEYWGGAPARVSCGRVRAQDGLGTAYFDTQGSRVDIRLADLSRFVGYGHPYSDDRGLVESWERGSPTSRSGNHRRAFVDLDGVQVTPDFADARPFAEGLAPARASDGWGYVDPQGNWVIEPRFDSASAFSDGLAKVRGQIIDRDGQIVFDGREYHAIEPFSEGLAAVNVYARGRHRHGYLDRDGVLAIPATYHQTTSFSEGRGAVLTRKGWGYIDRTGDWLIRPRFSTAGPFVDGLARVHQQVGPFVRSFGTRERVGYVDADGEWVCSWEETRPPPALL